MVRYQVCSIEVLVLNKGSANIVHSYIRAKFGEYELLIMLTGY